MHSVLPIDTMSFYGNAGYGRKRGKEEAEKHDLKIPIWEMIVQSTGHPIHAMSPLINHMDKNKDNDRFASTQSFCY